MTRNPEAPAAAYREPWTLKVYDALPGSPFWIGIAFAAAMLLLFVGGRVFLGVPETAQPDDMRVAVTQILMTAYSASAYAGLLITARRTTQDLAPVARQNRGWSAIAERAGKHKGWVLLLVGALSYLLIGVGVTNATTPEPVNPWDWHGWSYDVYWHRVTTVLFVWWIGCFCFVTVVESSRLSHAVDEIETIDILDLRQYRPLVRQGLTNALLVLGMISVMSLLAVESRYWPALLGFWIVFVLLAWIGMMLPLRGIRRKISMAKHKELNWCDRALISARDDLKSGAQEQTSVAEIVAYRNMIEGIKNWPFDNSTLARFTLYLMIPLGSWLGGALVERGVDFFLS